MDFGGPGMSVSEDRVELWPPGLGRLARGKEPQVSGVDGRSSRPGEVLPICTGPLMADHFPAGDAASPEPCCLGLKRAELPPHAISVTFFPCQSEWN